MIPIIAVCHILCWMWGLFRGDVLRSFGNIRNSLSLFASVYGMDKYWTPAHAPQPDCGYARGPSAQGRNTGEVSD